MKYPEYKYQEIAPGGLQNRNELVKCQDVKKRITGREDYCSMFRFNEDVKTYYDKTTNDKGKHTLSGYAGACYCDYLWIDIDRLTKDNTPDLQTAYQDVKYLLNRLTNEYEIDTKILRLYFSGHKGFHVGIPSVVFSLEPSERTPELCQKLAIELAGDIVIDDIYETIRLLRIPNTRHEKSGLYKTELCSDDMLRGDLELEHILELAKIQSKDTIECLDALEYEGVLSHLKDIELDTKTDTKLNAETPTQSYTPKTDKNWVIEALGGAVVGSRTKTLTRLIGHWADKKLSKDEILSLTLMWDKQNSPTLEQTYDKKKIPDTVNDILKRYHNGGVTVEPDEPQQRQGSKPASELIANPPEPKPCIVGGGVVPSWGYTLIGAETKMGKSTLIQQLCLCILTSTKFLNKFDIETKDTHILYLNLEIDEGTFLDTLNTQIENWGAKISMDNLRIWTLNGFCLTDLNDNESLKTEIKENHIELVIVDPVSYAMRYDQNKYEVIRAFSQKLDSISQDVGGVAWLLIHHFGKPKDAHSETIHKMIGSSAFSNFAQSIIGLERYSNTKSPDYKTINFRLRNGRPQQDITTILNSETRLFEVVTETPEMTAIKVDRVVSILNTVGTPQSYGELVRLIQNKLGLSMQHAKLLITKTVNSDMIEKGKGRLGKYWVKNKTIIV